MNIKYQEQQLAIKLRKQGKSYREIRSVVPVAKSTLSIWLRSVGLTKVQERIMTEKCIAAQRKGAQMRRKTREESEMKIKGEAMNDITERKLPNDLLWFLGIVLYWAEGVKQKTPHNVSQGVSFGNSDVVMIKLFIRWLRECCSVRSDALIYWLYIHCSADVELAKNFWVKNLGIEKEKIKVYLKEHNPRTHRKNTENGYHGLLRVDVRQSTNLNRKISGWIIGLGKRFDVL